MKNSKFMWIWLILLILLPILVTGCTALTRSHSPQVEPGTWTKVLSGTSAVTTKAGWAFNLSVLGVFASGFAIALGAGKLGWAGIAASVGAGVYSVVIAQYAGLVALLGLGVGIYVVVVALRRNKEDKLGPIKAFQEIKDRFWDLEASKNVRDASNQVMAKHLTPQMEKLVKEFKSTLDKEQADEKMDV